MESAWRAKRDPDRHPVRYLAGLVEQRTGMQFTPKEYGQLRNLRNELGEFTRDVIDWMGDPVHWWRFCQYVRAESRVHTTPAHFDVGFLLKQRTRALKCMRRELQQSTAPAHVSFCRRFDHRRYQGLRSFLVARTGPWSNRVAGQDRGRAHANRPATGV